MKGKRETEGNRECAFVTVKSAEGKRVSVDSRKYEEARRKLVAKGMPTIRPSAAR
jgi:tRNA A37 methylthiotransferase MiaB